MTEEVRDRAGKLLAVVVTGRDRIEPGLRFFTNPEHSLQVGEMRHREGHVIPAHRHVPTERRVIGTAEVLFVREGQLRADFYDDELQPIWTTVAETGDVLILLAGGHGFAAITEVVIEEVKQGPWLGDKDKVYPDEEV
jgi:hypothetical protein